MEFKKKRFLIKDGEVYWGCPARGRIYYSRVHYTVGKLLIKAYVRERDYRKGAWEVKWKAPNLHLLHYGTNILSFNPDAREVSHSLITSKSDKDGISLAISIFNLPYRIYRGRLVTLEEYFKIQERCFKRHREYWRKFIQRGIPLPIIAMTLGFTIGHSTSSRVEINGNRLMLPLSDSFGIVFTHLSPSTLLAKFITYQLPESEFDRYRLIGVWLIGRDAYTNELFLLRCPPRLMIASLETCRRWCLGIEKDDIIIQEV